MMSFGLSLVGLTYMVSFMFKESEAAFRKVALLYALIGFFFPTLFPPILEDYLGNISLS